MREFRISEQEAGIRLIKYAGKLLGAAPASLIHKFIRNKNIELNHKRCREDDLLKAGDMVELFLSDETIDKFSGGRITYSAGNTGNTANAGDPEKVINPGSAGSTEESENAQDTKSLDPKRILYEDDDYLFYNKPPGLITQSDKTGRVSLNDMLIAYTGTKGVFRPSVCNRLDTNTSGIVLCGRSLEGLKTLNSLMANRSRQDGRSKGRGIRKIYRALVIGRVDDEMTIRSWQRINRDNTVSVYDSEGEGLKEMVTLIRPITSGERLSYIECELITGRKHQIRAQLSHIGHPVAGDRKYGSRPDPSKASRQMLHAYRIIMPDEVLDGLTVTAGIPDDMQRIIEEI